MRIETEAIVALLIYSVIVYSLRHVYTYVSTPGRRYSLQVSLLSFHGGLPLELLHIAAEALLGTLV